MKALLKRIEKNYPDGFEAIGADAMRYTLLTSATDAQQLNVSLKKFAEVGRPLTDKLWNASKLVLSMVAAGPAEGAPEISALEDRWLLSRLDQTIAEVRAGFDSYRFHAATEAMYHFFWGDVCDWYLEIAKPRVREGDADSKRAVTLVLAEVLEKVLKVLHPLMPFITEEIWGHLRPVLVEKGVACDDSELLALAAFPVAGERTDAALEEQFEVLQEVVKAVRSLRLNAGVSPKDAVECRYRLLDPSLDPLLKGSSYLITSLANLKSFEAVPAAPERFAARVLSNVEIYVNLVEHMDIPAEIARNEKALEKQQKLVLGLESKLSNQGFVGNAPEQVVAAEREKLAEAKQKESGIAAVIADLQKLLQ
jgi:valyl-tRNA synthetase